VPLAVALGKPVPNPFNPSTIIPLTLPAAATVHLHIYDVGGRRVRSLHDGPLAAGVHRVLWDGRDDAGRELASGVYLIRLEGAGPALTQRVILLR
jgi:flagellar hook assembly protein FlgD